MWVSAWTMQFMKHVFPRLISPRRPGKEADRRAGVPRALTYRYYWAPTASQWFLYIYVSIFFLVTHSRRKKKKHNAVLIFTPLFHKWH